jgi:hypothetical protein
LGSNIPNNYIQTVGLGTGSNTATSGDSVLINEVLRNVITGSPDFTTSRKVSFQADFSSTQMSGIKLAEFGLFSSGTAGIGSVWQRESFNPITFDGTIELQVKSTIEIK